MKRKLAVFGIVLLLALTFCACRKPENSTNGSPVVPGIVSAENISL